MISVETEGWGGGSVETADEEEEGGEGICEDVGGGGIGGRGGSDGHEKGQHFEGEDEGGDWVKRKAVSVSVEGWCKAAAPTSCEPSEGGG